MAQTTAIARKEVARNLASAHGASAEELLGGKSQAAKRGRTPKLRRQIEQPSQLPRSQQRFVLPDSRHRLPAGRAVR